MSKRIVVTGATGFLGGVIATRLAGDHHVIGSGRSAVKGARLDSLGVRFERAELTDRKRLTELCRDADVVVHSAALSAPWGPAAAFYEANVIGTENVIEAAQLAGARLIHISSPSVLASRHDGYALDESTPIRGVPLNNYISSKRLAEARVADATRAGLRAVVLRPRGIIGAGDESVLPRIVSAMRRRRLPRIGAGDPLVDLTVVTNAAQAAALAALGPDSIEGATFHVTNGEPLRLSLLLGALGRHFGLEPPRLRVPKGLAWALATASELAHRLPGVQAEPTLTRYGVTLLGCTTTLDISAIQRTLGYRPTTSVLDGIAEFAQWWRTRP